MVQVLIGSLYRLPTVPSMTEASEYTAKDNENATNWDPHQIVGTLPATALPGPVSLLPPRPFSHSSWPPFPVLPDSRRVSVITRCVTPVPGLRGWHVDR